MRLINAFTLDLAHLDGEVSVGVGPEEELALVGDDAKDAALLLMHLVVADDAQVALQALQHARPHERAALGAPRRPHDLARHQLVH